MIYEVQIEDRTHQIQVERVEGGWAVRVDDGPLQQIQGARSGPAEWLFRQEGRGRAVGAWIDGEHVSLQIAGHPLSAQVIDPRKKALNAGSSANKGVVSTPMPGVITRILIEEGQDVQEGEVLLVVEAMKMENEYRSPCDGTVQTIHVVAGAAVEAHTVLVTVEPASP